MPRYLSDHKILQAIHDACLVCERLPASVEQTATSDAIGAIQPLAGELLDALDAARAAVATGFTLAERDRLEAELTEARRQRDDAWKVSDQLAVDLGYGEYAEGTGMVHRLSDTALVAAVQKERAEAALVAEGRQTLARELSRIHTLMVRWKGKWDVEHSARLDREAGLVQAEQRMHELRRLLDEASQALQAEKVAHDLACHATDGTREGLIDRIARVLEAS